jgi:hypothetical protein
MNETPYYYRWTFAAAILLCLMLFNAGACAITNNPFWWNGKRYNHTTTQGEKYEEVR